MKKGRIVLLAVRFVVSATAVVVNVCVYGGHGGRWGQGHHQVDHTSIPEPNVLDAHVSS
jgi:hypothetical protein